MNGTKFLRASLFLAAAATIAALHTGAAFAQVIAEEEEVIRVDTSLVQVDIRATRDKKMVGLRKEDLQLTVDDRAQAIESFDVSPIRLYKIVLDASGSMAPRKYKRSVEGLVSMMREAARLDSEVKFEILIFNHELTNIGVFRADEDSRVEPLLLHVKPQGGTALFASVKSVLSRNCGQRFALVVITDGLDTSVDPSAVSRALSATGNITYILLLDPRLNTGYEQEIVVNDVLTRPIGRKMQAIFESVVLYPDDRDDIISDLTNIVGENRSIARISFSPAESDAKTHRVRISHADSKVKLVYRENFLMANGEVTVASEIAAVKTRAEAEIEEVDRVFNDVLLKDKDAKRAFAAALVRQPKEWTDAERVKLRGTLPANLRKLDGSSAKLRAKLLPVLNLFNRTSYEIIVVENDKPFVANFRTVAVVVTTGALDLLCDDEIRLAVAHELAHELTGDEITRAIAVNDFTTIRKIELYSDGVALLAADILRIKPKMLVQSIEKIVSRIKELDPTYNDADQSHPTVETRKLLFNKMVSLL